MSQEKRFQVRVHDRERGQVQTYECGALVFSVLTEERRPVTGTRGTSTETLALLLAVMLDRFERLDKASVAMALTMYADGYIEQLLGVEGEFSIKYTDDGVIRKEGPPGGG